MTPPTPQLFGRILSACGLCPIDVVQAYVDGLPDATPEELGQRLVADGHLDARQLSVAAAILNQELSGSGETEFDRLVDLKRHARAGDLEKVMALQQSFGEDGEYAYLSELLAVKSEIAASQLAKSLGQSQALLFCERCCTREVVDGHQSGQAHACGSCGGVLREPRETGMLEEAA